MGISTHVLDTTRGRPAQGVEVVLERAEGGAFARVGAGATDADGRVRALLPEGQAPEAGEYRITFAVGAWFEGQGVAAFYPEVQVHFRVGGGGHLHVPLLLSPFGYSTYRGS